MKIILFSFSELKYFNKQKFSSTTKIGVCSIYNKNISKGEKNCVKEFQKLCHR